MNPFKYGQVVSGEDFCPRPKLLRQMTSFLKGGQNVVVQGERRIGKTSFICEAARRLKKQRILYADLLEVKTSDDFCKRLVKAIVSLEQQSGFLERILKSLAQLKPTLTIDSLTGQPTISVDASVRLQPDSIDGLLSVIQTLHRCKSLVVVLDEFQDILNLKDCREVLAILRSKIQFHTRIPYIFAGSVRNRMAEIFTDPESAFFKSAVSLNVGPLDPEQFTAFLAAKFSQGKRAVDAAVFDKVLQIAENIPGDVQQLCGALWETSSYRSRITEGHLPAALLLIYARESKGYEAMLVLVTGQQLKCLVGLAKMGGEAPLSADFIRGVGITLPASIQKALNRLVKLRIIYRHEGEYKFINPFFKSWLIYKNY